MWQSQISKYKKVFIFSGIISLALIGIGWRLWQRNEESRSACIRRIDYLGGNNSYRLRDFQNAPRFKTHDEAMTYCLQELKR